MKLRLGLNPYGLTYHLGLQGAGTPRANPKGAGLEGFIATDRGAWREGPRDLRPLVRAMSDDELRALQARLASLGMAAVRQLRAEDGDIDLRAALRRRSTPSSSASR